MKLFPLLLLSFFINQLCAAEHPFVILIPSYNNSEYVIDNLTSCVDQNYENFRVIYINDNSTDNTLKKVEEFIENSENGFRIELINNSTRELALSNIYNTIHKITCPDEIVVLVDGDDKLANLNVLEYLNSVYNNEKILMTYGQFGVENSRGGMVKGFASAVPHRNSKSSGFRKLRNFPFTHLRTFYSWLFKKIPRSEFLDAKGDFFKSAWDLAIMYPLLEMSNGRYKYIDKILYIYNANNPISDHKLRRAEQYYLSNYIKRKTPLKGLKNEQLPKFFFENY